MGPRGFVVLTADAAAFAAQYPGVPVAGTYLGKLDNGGEKLTLAGPDGAVALRTFRRGGALLLLGTPATGEGWAALAVFTSQPVWSDARGEAPGREPQGLPRLGSGRRLLHLQGDGFEAACYHTAASPHAVVAEGVSRLPGAGWTLGPASDQGLTASRRGAPPVAMFLRPDGTGAVLLVVSGSPKG